MTEVDRVLVWVRGQLDVDERAASAAYPGPWVVEAALHGRGQTADVVAVDQSHDGWGIAQDGEGVGACSVANAEHIVLHDPLAVLALVVAHRAILDLHIHTVKRADTYPFSPMTGEPAPVQYDVECAVCGVVYSGERPEACLTVRHIAAAYAHRDGYEEAWRPA